ncbi:MAG: exodeoxyribonuclease VII small subunit [Akkermansia sp.]|nr:exodeoxyribonuclease VII small subunit [Akkermansia sp.]
MATKGNTKAPSFEQAAARLEEIVALMDNPSTGMEDMIALAEEGLTLLRSSKKMLAEAELKIRKLEAPEPASAEPGPAAGLEEASDDFSLL